MAAAVACLPFSLTEGPTAPWRRRAAQSQRSGRTEWTGIGRAGGRRRRGGNLGCDRRRTSPASSFPLESSTATSVQRKLGDFEGRKEQDDLRRFRAICTISMKMPANLNSR
nr:uncharacterized protein LOC120969784 [Aegilops tauschii subsp. strangulata]